MERLKLKKTEKLTKVSILNQGKTYLRDVSSQNISAGLISFTLIMTGPALIILQAAATGHFTSQQTINWIFSVYFFGGIFGILLPLLFRIPITGGHSISGVAFLATVTANFTYPQLIGGYVLSGLLILIIGLSGIFTKMIKWVPKEVISAMLAGLVTNYVVQLVASIKVLPIIGGAALLSYFIGIKFSRKIPAVMIAVVVAFIALFVSKKVEIAAATGFSFSFPEFVMPEFTWSGIVTLAVPLALLILSNDVATGIGALESSKFEPPIRKIVSLSGGFSIIASFFGGQSANIAGMMTAICANPESGVRTKRYLASIISGVLTVLFGIFSWKIVPFIQSLPKEFVSMLAGFSLIGVLLSSLQMGFSENRYRLSALFAFLIPLSQVSFFHISAPVWGLVVGAILAKTVEK
ncbi:benzoate/H(+) symporter BenE family transporter [Bacillus sp. DNRA2]|uniref:benzoate/H(+) symporter BenE family transporter n=1 Tax=Bacillus sp. DNRA2 TaxID=2723053 RepID=UPI00145E209E|nr:benzoate/H(+) symporter BenE family transporter [Bacillus sp. DNRA2]NMD72083.1 benzoate/H(+) symporter BenE family transporter [Bacillus sp. DNRA2]